MSIRVGIGGWTYAPWRSTFFPAKLPHDRELEYASRRLTAIEVNGTFYRNQSPAVFAKWRRETPDDFMFSLKAPRYATYRKILAEAGDSVHRFLDSGPAELGPKLGPLLWQFPPHKRFEPDDFAAFLELLPPKLGKLKLRHALEVRHPSFDHPAFFTLAARHQAAVVYADSADYPALDRPTAGFTYARLMRARASVKTGYTSREIGGWAKRARAWEQAPATAGKSARKKTAARDVFVFFINGAKERAPAAAQALLERLGNGRD